MTELAACATATKPRHWFAPVAIVVAFAIFNVFLDPFGNREGSWFVGILIGGLFEQPVLLAMWAAFGPTPAIRRIPLSIAALAAILLAPAVAKQFEAGELSDTEAFVMVSGMFLVLFALLLIVGKLRRWRIEILSDAEIQTNEASRFSIKFMLALMSICAVLLTAARGLSFAKTSLAGNDIDRLLIVVVQVVLLALPAIGVPLAVLTKRLPRKVYALAPFVWAVYEVAMLAIFHYFDGLDAEDVRSILLIHLGMLVTGLATALVLRFNGYRWVRAAAQI